MTELLTFQKESQNTICKSEVGSSDNHSSSNDNTLLNSNNANSSTQKIQSNDLSSSLNDSNLRQENPNQSSANNDTISENELLLNSSSTSKIRTKKQKRTLKAKAFPSERTSPPSGADPLASLSSRHTIIPFSDIGSQTETVLSELEYLFLFHSFTFFSKLSQRFFVNINRN
jgi:hypothetical protein